MKKLGKMIVLIITTFALTSCPATVIDDDDDETPTSYTIDHSVCNGSATQTIFQGSINSVLAVPETTSAATAINACYGVGGQAYYYGASGFLYSRSPIDNEGKYTYYMVTSSSGILHRFINDVAIEDNTLASENVTVVNNGLYEVTLGNGQRYTSSFLGTYYDADVAVFTIRTQDSLPLVDIASSDDLFIGQSVQAVGTPIFGTSLINTVTQGVISGLNRRFMSVFSEGELSLTISDHPAFQFDAPLNGGMEGGPVFNTEGGLVGIITYKYESDVESLSMAIPIDDVRKIIDTIIASTSHTFTRVMIGINVGDLESYPQNAIMTDGGNVTQGLYISSVSLNSNASNASPTSMQVGEILTGITINSVYFAINNIGNLAGKLWRCEQGDTIILQTKVANSGGTAVVTKDYTITIA